MNVFEDFNRRVEAIAADILREAGIEDTTLLGNVVVEPPREAEHGDMATNAAMVLAKPLRTNPRDLAERIVEALRADPDVETLEIAGPGFINLRLKAAFWFDALRSLLASGDAFGRSDAGAGKKVNVEYVSGNPTGPMHIGHCRGAVVGDAMANLLAATGYAVTREYYINDAGAQVDVLARSAHLRYREALGEDVGAIPEGLYPGDYLKAVGQELASRHGRELIGDEADWLPVVRDVAIEMMMASIREDLAMLDIRHDVFFSERSLTADGDRIATAIDWLEEHGLIYVGKLPPPKGQVPDDWEDREQTLFRSTDFGDDVDRAIRKSDGSYTYFASDIAYHFDKFRRGYSNMIDVLGADHGGYVKRMQAAVRAITEDRGRLDVRLCQLVRLFRGGEPVKMSKRSGEFVTLREVVDEVGADPIRFMMVYRKSEAPLDFDFRKVTEQSKDNPVFYVQYAHARTASVERMARDNLPQAAMAPVADTDLDSLPLERLEDDGEMALIRQLMAYPRAIEAAASAREPHRVAFYLHDLASMFHAHWNRGKELPQLRFTDADDPEASRARLALVHAVKLVLGSGLAILGVSAPDEMR